MDECVSLFYLDYILYCGKVWWGGKFGELTLFEHLGKESLANYRSANRLLIVSTNLDGFSLANHGRFAKFAKLSRHTVSHA